MNIKMNYIEYEHFKGCRQFRADFNSRNARAIAENGKGKTRLYDAFLWCLFGKDSTGRTDSGKGAFEVWPLDTQDEKIPGVQVKVTIEVSIDDEIHTFRRELHEHVVKDQLRGYQTLCWIDDVPKKVKEYGDYIAKVIAEETFKLLTDLTFFNEKFHWQERRKILLALAGQQETPKGYAALLSQLNGRTIPEYREVVTEQKKRYEEERDGIGPRIDELSREVDLYIAGDIHMLEDKRKSRQAHIEHWTTQREILLAAETQRQKTLSDISNLEVEKRKREVDLANDTSAVQELIKERGKLQADLAEKEEAYNVMVRQQTTLENDMAEANEKHKRQLQKLQECRDKISQIEKFKDSDLICPACGQDLPKSRIAKMKADRTATINDAKNLAKNIANLVSNYEEALRTAQSIRNEHVAIMQAEYKALKELRETTQAQIEKLNEALTNRPTIDPGTDDVWLDLTAKIEASQNELGEPVADQLIHIESKRQKAADELVEINKALAHADRAKKDKARIQELTDRQKALAQKIADCDKTLAEIRRFEADESRLLEKAVNDRFKYVTFKLYRQQLNGDIDNNRCDTIYEGRPFNDISTGEKIRVGVDIVNTLSDHYDLSIPLFIDHAESLTLPIEAKSQTIELVARDDAKELRIEIIEEDRQKERVAC